MNSLHLTEDKEICHKTNLMIVLATRRRSFAGGTHPRELWRVRSIGHKSSTLHKYILNVDSWQMYLLQSS